LLRGGVYLHRRLLTHTVDGLQPPNIRVED
jgi:hypothetical protein